MAQRTREAFVAFVEENRSSLARTAQLLTGNPNTAEDLAQEALIRAYKNWRKVEVGSELAYVRRVMANLNTDWWRRRRFESSYEAPERCVSSFEEQVADRDAIVRQLAKLSPRERTMVVLRYYADQTAEAVAQTLGVTVGTVKSTCHRALARLSSQAEDTYDRSMS